MTYCLGILLPKGLVLASDSRTNAGVDQIATVRKIALFEEPDDRVIVLLSAGNLATTQAIVSILKQRFRGDGSGDLLAATTMFDAAQFVGDLLREVIAREGEHVRPYGDPNASFLLGGQIRGERPRLFQIYSAGNFIEASPRSQFLQIGETKYGKPILDRALSFEMDLEEATKYALLSFDSTIRSNLSVAPPIDVLCYATDSFSSRNQLKYKESDPYFGALRKSFREGLIELVKGLPQPSLKA